MQKDAGRLKKRPGEPFRIDALSEEGMPLLGQVNAYLVGATGFEAARNER